MTFVLVGNSARIALPVLQAVRSFTNRNCVLAGTRERMGLRWSRLCDRHELIDLADDERCANLLNGLANKTPEPLLIPFDCDGASGS